MKTTKTKIKTCPDGLERGTFQELQINPQGVVDFLNALRKQKQELQSLMILRDNKVCAEGWWKPYRPEYPHELCSLTKSFTSTAIGMAIDRGLLGMDDKVISFFPEYAHLATGERWQKMTVRHLLTMSNGHGVDSSECFRENDDCGDWAKAFFELPLQKEPGTEFFYDSGASYILGRIVAKAAGMDMADWLKQNMFEPMNIRDFSFIKCPQGYSIGGWGMKVKTSDIAKLGLLYLNGGVWNGKQLLSRWWTAEAGKPQIGHESCYGSGYGYQFWCSPYGAYNANGAYGQFCFIIPDKRAVVAITSCTDMAVVSNLVFRHLYPAFAESPPVVDEKLCKTLERRLKRAALPVLPVRGTLRDVQCEYGKTYKLIGENCLKLQSISFETAGTVSKADNNSSDGLRLVMKMSTESGDSEVVCGSGMWNKLNLCGEAQTLSDGTIAACYCCSSQDRLQVRLRGYEEFATLDMDFRFAGGALSVAGEFQPDFQGSQFVLQGIREDRGS